MKNKLKVLIFVSTIVVHASHEQLPILARNIAINNDQPVYDVNGNQINTRVLHFGQYGTMPMPIIPDESLLDRGGVCCARPASYEFISSCCIRVGQECKDCCIELLKSYNISQKKLLFHTVQFLFVI